MNNDITIHRVVYWIYYERVEGICEQVVKYFFILLLNIYNEFADFIIPRCDGSLAGDFGKKVVRLLKKGVATALCSPCLPTSLIKCKCNKSAIQICEAKTPPSQCISLL